MKDTSVRNFFKNDCDLLFKKINPHPILRNGSSKLANRVVWAEEWTKSDMNFLKNCVLDELGFGTNMRPPEGSQKGTLAVVTTSSTRKISHTVLGAIIAKYAVSMELWSPQVSKKIKIDFGNRKRKISSTSSKRTPKGTVTNHYM